METDIHFAKTNLSKLIRQAEAGEEIIITRRGERIVRLTPIRKPEPKFDTLKTAIGEFDERVLYAMPDEEADAFIDGFWE